MSMPTLNSITDYIDYYYSKLLSTYKSNNFKLVKTGFVGYILNVLGNTQYDIKQYYDSLYNEAFPVTSLDDTNLEYHSELYGMTRSLATPSTVTDGVFKINLDALPSINSNLISRVITFGASTAVVGDTLSVGITAFNNSYTCDALYNLKAKIINGSIVAYDAEILSPTGQKNIGISTQDPKVAIINTTQIYRKIISRTIPYYKPTTFYNIPITLKAGEMLAGISAIISDSNTGLVETYSVDINKTKYDGASKVVFYSIKSNNTINIQLGSGTIGKYIQSNSTLELTLDITAGESGNISTYDSNNMIMATSYPFASSAYVIDTYSSLTNPITTIVSLKSLLTPVINTSIGGVDILTGDKLRSSLETYIQSYDHLISELDYNNYLKSVYDEYYVSFKKTLLSSNTIYAYLPLYDKYKKPYKLTTISTSLKDFETIVYTQPVTNVSVVYHPTVTINSVNMVSPFYYKYDTLFRSYYGYYLSPNHTFNYTSIKAVDANNKAIITNLPYIQLNLKYHHNNISPFTIISISSYEDLTQYVTAPSSITIQLTTPAITLQTNTVLHIPNSGLTKTTITTILSSSITSTDVTIPLSNISILANSGTILIDSEQITYTGKDLVNNTITGCTRGVNATTAATHLTSATVYELTTSLTTAEFILGVIATSLTSNITTTDTTIPVSDTSYFPTTGIFYIDNEEISYTGKTLTSFTGCTRGSNSTTATTHNSSVGVYEKTTTTNAVANPALYFGILDSDTTATITLYNSTTTNTYTFSFSLSQLYSLSGNLFIKEFVNDLSPNTALTSAITNTDTTIPVISTTGWPTSGYAKISQEYLYYSSVTATSLTGVIRGIYNTTASSALASVVITPISISEVDVPYIEKSSYDTDSLFIDTQITTNILSLNIPSNRSLSDDIQLRFLNTFSVPSSDMKTIVYNGSSYTFDLLFPLKIKVELLLNNSILVSTGADLNSDLFTLKQTIANELLSKYTGVKIRISDATIIVLCKKLSYVDDANVTFTDSNSVQIPSNEINVKPDLNILTAMTKPQRVNYTPPMWYWDVNNINITYTTQ